jgi:hypothetical protein
MYELNNKNENFIFLNFKNFFFNFFFRFIKFKKLLKKKAATENKF